MLRPVIAAFMICFFGFNLIETPYPLLQGSSMHGKCCCRSVTVCQCAHGKKLCPLKPVLKPIKEKDGSLVLKAMGCGFRDDHEVSPTYSKDFDSKLAATYFYAPASGSFLKLIDDNISSLFDHRLDKPPKVTLLSFF